MSNKVDMRALTLKRCNDFLKTREGLISLFSVKGFDWWSGKQIDVSVEDAIRTVQNSWLNSFGFIAKSAHAPNPTTQTIHLLVDSRKINIDE